MSGVLFLISKIYAHFVGELCFSMQVRISVKRSNGSKYRPQALFCFDNIKHAIFGHIKDLDSKLVTN